MIDPKLIRQNIEAVANQLHQRGFELPIVEINLLEQQRKSLQIKTQALQNERNQLSSLIGQAKSKGEAIEGLLAQVGQLGDQLQENEAQLEAVQAKLHTILCYVPNLPHESVSVGKSDKDNVEIRRWKEIPQMTFVPRDHVDLGELNGLMNFETASKLSGSRFVVLYGRLAKLQRALIQFMLDVHITQHGYQEVYVPYLVNRECLYGTGQIPKLENDLFSVQGEPTLFLIPTAEVSLTNLVSHSILEENELPKRFVAHTPCFRKEAGSYGKDTRGMIRQHQFEKVELVWIEKPENSYQALEQLTQHAEKILQLLDLPYRVMALCGGDLGFSSAKTYDLEVWLPSQGCYREISSCSNMTDFQARRLQARWRNKSTGKPELAHTLNGSGLAIGRTLVAILENYQDEQGRVRIPDVLQRYFGDEQLI